MLKPSLCHTHCKYHITYKMISIGFSYAYRDLLLDSGALPLAISLEHAAAVEGLPAHHRDPFDRLLVVQAVAENATIVSCDEIIGKYDAPILW